MKSSITLFTFLLVLISFLSCSDQEKLIIEEENFTSVDIPVTYKQNLPNGRNTSSAEEVIRDIKVTNLKGEVVYGKVKLIFPMEGDGLISFEMTRNIFDQTELTPTFWTDALSKADYTGGRVEGIGSCLKDCQSLAQGEGRGWCKAGCWVELAAVVAVVIIAL